MKNTIRMFAGTIALAFCLTLSTVQTVWAQGSAFTYQGTLNNNNLPGNGNFDFEFKLFDQLNAGIQQGATLQRLNVPVTNGGFTVTLDFGAAVFTGAPRFLEISVRSAGGGAFTLLTPRQAITATPYAIKAANATAADGLSAACVGCITSAQIQAGGAYINNATTSQTGANFNIGGSGTAGGTLSGNIVNAAAQFNFNGNRVLSAPVSSNGTNNLYAGVGAGTADTGTGNTFVGTDAGASNTTGSSNSFFGSTAGNANSTGGGNAFFGSGAGKANTTGQRNSFFGLSAGAANTTAENNSFFGGGVGFANTTGSNNSFFGGLAGLFNTTGGSNSFFGSQAGNNNTTANNNAFFGYQAGNFNTTGSNNSFFGTNAGYFSVTGHGNLMLGNGADVRSSRSPRAGEAAGDNNLFIGRSAGAASTRRNAAAIGSYAFAACDDCLVLGDSSLPAFMVGIGTDTPEFRLHVRGTPATHLVYAQNDSQDPNAVGVAGSADNGYGILGTTLTSNAVRGAAFGAGGVGVYGTSASGYGVQGLSNSNIGIHGRSVSSAGVYGTSDNSWGVHGVSTANFGVYGQSTSSYGVYGESAASRGVYGQSTSGYGVYGASTTSIGVRGKSVYDIGVFAVSDFNYAGYFSGDVYVSGAVIQTSDARLKQEVAALGYGLRQILQLRPVSWTWKRKPNAGRQFGLIAQEVETILPELVSTDKGAEQTKGINYSGLTPVVINAIQEQQAQIEQQKARNILLQQQLNQQQTQIEAMKRALCQAQPREEFCVPSAKPAKE